MDGGKFSCFCLLNSKEGHPLCLCYLIQEAYDTTKKEKKTERKKKEIPLPNQPGYTVE
jgi:hypothetical protein